MNLFILFNLLYNNNFSLKDQIYIKIKMFIGVPVRIVTIYHNNQNDPYLCDKKLYNINLLLWSIDVMVTEIKDRKGANLKP